MKRNQFIMRNTNRISSRMLTIICEWDDIGLYDGDRDPSDMAAYTAAINSLAQEQQTPLE